MQSSSRRALYIGMTNNLHKRVFQHKTHRFEGFTDDYNAARLVYWESFDEVQKAINRETDQTLAAREEALADLTLFNRGWKDLAAEWYPLAEGTQGPLCLVASLLRRGARDDGAEEINSKAKKKSASSQRCPITSNAPLRPSCAVRLVSRPAPSASRTLV